MSKSLVLTFHDLLSFLFLALLLKCQVFIESVPRFGVLVVVLRAVEESLSFAVSSTLAYLLEDVLPHHSDGTVSLQFDSLEFLLFGRGLLIPHHEAIDNRYQQLTLLEYLVI